MDNQNALTSTAMLASIWEKEQKDNLELILPFITYSIGKVTSMGNQIDVASISAFVSSNFGFFEIPHSVLYKAFTRLTKRNILLKKNKQFMLASDLSERCVAIDALHDKAKTQTDIVITALTEYLNQKKEHILKKDMSVSEVKDCFVKFLESKGYFVYFKISKLREISMHESTLHYYIAQFILDEYDKKSEVFLSVDNIVKGLLLSRIIYGYVDTQYNEKFKDVCIYIDSALLLHIFGFKSKEENTAAAQMIEILRSSNIPVKCFKHNFSEVYKIIEAYKYGILDPSNRHGQTLERFDELSYSATDIDRVLLNLDEYFQEKSIEIVDTPSLSSDGSGVIASSDFPNAIGEVELKSHLAKEIFYKNGEALANDVYSISAIFTLRRGKSFKKLEECKALFATTNSQLAYTTQTFMRDTINSTPLLISDLELTTILWLKNHKNFSNFPTLKLIEAARLSLEPTEQIRAEFIKKIEQFKTEPAVTNEMAANYRQLLYTEKEKVMELISANPENVPNIQLNDLEYISRQHYNAQLTSENQNLKQSIDETKRRLWIESNKKIERSGKKITVIYKIVFYAILAILLAVSVKGLFLQWQTEKISIYSLVMLGFSVVGIIDAISPRLHFLDKLIRTLSNKHKVKIIRQEQERVQKILGDIEL